MPRGRGIWSGTGAPADVCILGEPTEGKIVLGHFRLALAADLAALATSIHTAVQPRARRDQNSLVRMHDVLDAVLEWIPTWEDDPRTRTAARRRSSTSARSQAASAGASRGRRTAPTSSSTCACRRRRTMAVARREVLDMVRGLQERFPDYGSRARST
jgi:hypothetical protein